MLSVTFVLLHVLFLGTTSGQTTNTACSSNSTTSFLFNKAGESPCLVWSKLQSLCIPDSAFVNVPPLVDQTYGYNSPGQQGTACQCNVAAYKLMAACSWCQVGGDSTWASQWAYGAGCADFKQDSLGFTQDVVDLPPFVWRNWDTARFDPALAAAAAPSFATISLAPASTTLSRFFPPAVPSTSSAPSQSSVSQSSTAASINGTSASVPSATDSNTSDTSLGDKAGDAGTPWAIILGSIGGAVAAVIVVSMIIFFCFLRRKRRRQRSTGAEGTATEPKLTPDNPSGRRFDPSYPTSKDWKHRSFLDMLSSGQAAPGLGASTNTSTKRQSKRMTELFNDPKSFFSPRAAPRPLAAALKYSNSNESIETLRYTTTSERLKSRNRTESFSSGSEVSFGVGPPKVVPTAMGMGYTKAKDSRSQPRDSGISVIPGVITRGPDAPGLLAAVKVMKKEDGDDPLDTPSSTYTPPPRAFGDSPGYPFPRVTTPPALLVHKGLAKPPPLKSRLSTKIPDSRFSTTSSTSAVAIPLPHPPVTAATDFTLPPEEYRRKQSRHYSGPKGLTVYQDNGKKPRASAAATLPSMYEPTPGATRFSLSRSQKEPDSGSDAESLIFSATPSTESRYPSFIPDVQTVQRVKGMFGMTNVQFPLPPSTSPRKSVQALSPQEWNKAKGKAKLTQEVMKVGKKDPVQERGNENGFRRGGEI